MVCYVLCHITLGNSLEKDLKHESSNFHLNLCSIINYTATDNWMGEKQVTIARLHITQSLT